MLPWSQDSDSGRDAVGDKGGGWWEMEVRRYQHNEEEQQGEY